MARALAVDFGQSRIGLAIAEGELVLPIEAIANNSSQEEEIAAIASQRSVDLIVVGLPLSLSGAHTASTKAAIEFAHRLAALAQLEVRMVDERLTTVGAQAKLRESGKSTKESKSRIDSESAGEILRLAISQIKLGRKPGIGLDEID